MTDHQDFEQLAVGYAFHALEPEDEQLLTAHLASCSACSALIIAAEAVAAALAESMTEAAPPSDLRERLLLAASKEPRVVPPSMPQDPWPTLTLPPTFPTPEARRPRLRGRLLAGALAGIAVIVIALPTAFALSSAGTGRSGDGLLAQRLLETGSREVSLTSANNPSHAKAVLTSTGALMIADELPVNDAQRTTYVLWAANRSGLRTAIATFDVSPGKAIQVATAALPFKVDQITQISVSLEPGRRAPPSPSDVVLSGSST